MSSCSYKKTFLFSFKKKSRIRETKHLSTDADSSTDTKTILLVRQISPKKKIFFFLRGDLTPFMSKSFTIRDHFLPLLIPKDSENLKSLDIGLQEVGAKRRLNGVNKVLRTHKHTNILTYRKNRPSEHIF